MKLTGKALEQWLTTEKLGLSINLNDDRQPFIIDLSSIFNKLPPSFQWGVYQDFADSLGYEMNIRFYEENSGKKWWHAFISGINYSDDYETRNEARESAIEKLNELINE